jgi:hypothetical protein
MARTHSKLDFGFGVFPYSYVSFAEMAELAKLGRWPTSSSSSRVKLCPHFVSVNDI